MTQFPGSHCVAAIILALAAAPALASQPLLFEWSGVDSNNDPFSVAFTVTDAQNGDTGYDFSDFSSTVFVATEAIGQSQIVTDVTSDTLGGAFVYPNATNDDPYFFLFASAGAGNTGTYLQIAAGADESNIGLTFNGNVVEYLEVAGELPFAFGDPSTAASLSDLFPAGAYAVTDGFGLFSWNAGAGTEFPTPDTLTISVIPEPTTAALLAFGGLALLRRR